MATSTTSDRLVQAAELRRLAHQLNTLRVVTVHRMADGDTWVGPLAQQCHDTLLFHARLVVNHAEHLLVLARRLEWSASVDPGGPR